MEELTIGENKYISSKRASDITGYAKDYIGQLCREGRVEARLVGRSWYVREASLRDHRFGGEEESVAVVKDLENQNESENTVIDVVRESRLTEIPEISEIENDENHSENDVFESVVDTATQMQSAWQEWFSKNKIEEPAENIKLTKIVSGTEAAQGEKDEEEPIMIKIDRETLERNDIETVVPEQKNHPVLVLRQEFPSTDVLTSRVVSERVIYPPSYLGVKISLAVIALMVIGITLVGSGFFTLPIEGTPAAAINFLKGTTLINK